MKMRGMLAVGVTGLCWVGSGASAQMVGQVAPKEKTDCALCVSVLGEGLKHAESTRKAILERNARLIREWEAARARCNGDAECLRNVDLHYTSVIGSGERMIDFIDDCMQNCKKPTSVATTLSEAELDMFAQVSASRAGLDALEQDLAEADFDIAFAAAMQASSTCEQNANQDYRECIASWIEWYGILHQQVDEYYDGLRDACVRNNPRDMEARRACLRDVAFRRNSEHTRLNQESERDRADCKRRRDEWIAWCRQWESKTETSVGSGVAVD